MPASHKRAILAEGGQPPGGYETVPGQRAGLSARADRPRQAEEPRRAAAVLAERIAAMLAHREPGWRLPRYTAMARRYQVSTAEIDAAIGELAARHLIRRLPDGQVYRASPAEYLVPLEGVPGLASHVDPMGAELTCRSRQVSWRQVPEDIGRALRIPPSGPACEVSLRWTVNGEPAAITVTYLPASLTGPITAAYPAEGGRPEQEIGAVTGLNLLPLTARPERPEEERAALIPAGRPGALHFEMQLPPAAVARSLRLSASEPAAMVAVRFDDPQTGQPVALTFAAIRPDLFRIVVGSGESPLPEGGRAVDCFADRQELLPFSNHGKDGDHAVKVQIDSERCQGHGRCYDLVPSLFGEDDEGYGKVLGDGVVPPGHEREARLAVANCPERAIDLLEEA